MKQTYLEHSHYLQIIKRILKAQHIAWETQGTNKSLIVKIDGKIHSLPLEGEEINHETYKHLINNLLGNTEEKVETVSENPQT